MALPPNALRGPHLDDDDDEDDDKKKAVGPGFLQKALYDQRTILVCKPVDRELMAQITAQLMALDGEDSEAPITMVINCPGGDADSGFGIYDAMRMTRAPIRTVVMGLAASAAIVIFLGGTAGHRFCTPNSRFLIHQPSTQSQGTASDIAITAEQIVLLREQYNGIISEATGQPADKILEDATRDFWLTAQEALDYKLTDKIISSRDEIS